MHIHVDLKHGVQRRGELAKLYGVVLVEEHGGHYRVNGCDEKEHYKGVHHRHDGCQEGIDDDS